MRKVLLTALGCAALLLALGSYRAQAQAIKPGLEQQLSQLRQQIVALEHRVTELEKTKGGGVITQSDTSSSAKSTEGKSPAAQTAMTTVRAPFIVQNAAGKTIFRVDAVPGDNRAIVEIGDAKGARVHLGPNAVGGATIGLFDSSNAPGVYIVGAPDKNYVSVVKGKRASTIFADDTGSSAIVYNATGIPVGTMESGNASAGRLKIAGPAGDVLIDVGITADNVGWVRTSGPGGGGISTTPGVPHSYIRGWKK